MNKILGFIKSNLVIVISVVLIMAFLPTGYVFASKWNKKVYEEANAAYSKEKRTLTSKGKITYSLPAVLEGETDLSETRAPNHAVTEFYKAHKEEREGEVGEVVERGTEFNRGEHVELVPGLLPKASDDRTLVRLAREMGEAITGTNAVPSVYQRKLQRLNAGSPPTPESLTATLEDFKNREQMRYENSNANGKMNQAQSDQLDKDLISRRLGEYIGRAKTLTFYCSPDAFVNGETGVSTGRTNTRTISEYSVIPAKLPPLSTIDEGLILNWLWDYWIVSDVLDSVALANTDAQTGAKAIPDAPIKSIESIRISKIEVPTAVAISTDSSAGSMSGQFASGGRDNRGGGGQSNTDSPIVEEVGTSFTGRIGGQATSAFDIRTIELVVVADSRGLPGLIDAMGKTNYMTVIGLDLAPVDIWSDIEQGYYYGDDHVVRATITIESVWLRSWLEPLMPDGIKQALGIPLNDNPEDSDG